MKSQSMFAASFIQSIPHVSDFDETNSESGISQLSLQQQQLNRLTKRRRNKTRNSTLTEGSLATASSKKRGSRVRRRLESAAFIESYAHLLVIEEEDYDLICHEETALSQLFADPTAMKVWQDFIQLEEEDQQEILESAAVSVNAAYQEIDPGWIDLYPDVYSEKDKRKSGRKSTKNVCDLCDFQHTGGFGALHQRYRQLLGRRHLPLGWICGIENGLREYFSDKSTTSDDSDNGTGGKAHYHDHDYVIPQYWEQTESDSYRRLFIHMVAQYLGLLSRSNHDGNICNPTVIVENRSHLFSPPCVKLNDYLMRYRIPCEL